MRSLTSILCLIGYVLLFGACDGANDVMETPPVSGKLVFVTSERYSGDLGGLAGADAICRQRAVAGGHSGSFRAWLGDDSSSPADRLNHSSQPYLLVDGTVLADSWDNLVDGSGAWLDLDETGTQNTGTVWTGAHEDGSSVTPNCENWTTGAHAVWGRTGQNGTRNLWSDDGTGFWCDYASRLYCFEQ